MVAPSVAQSLEASASPGPVKPPAPASLHIQQHHGLSGGRFNPTHLHLVDSDGREVEWQSRRARKRRYAAKSHHIGQNGHVVEGIALRVQSLGDQLKPHLMYDVSFWIAVWFTLGSTVWVINGFLTWLPFIYPSVGTDRNAHTAAGLAFLGGTIFNIGSYLMVVEALDRGRETQFGTALGRLLHDIAHPTEMKDAESGFTTPSDKNLVGPDAARGFAWWGKPLWHEFGYDAALVQLCAACTFWIATLTGLPGVIPGLFDGEHVVIGDVFFWSPQVIGGSGFVISSAILMIEVQHHWWQPRPLDIGWQVGVWNLVGALGFLLCGALGYSKNSRMEYESALATFWGSWAFLIGSCCQVWEVVWREPPQS